MTVNLFINLQTIFFLLYQFIHSFFPFPLNSFDRKTRLIIIIEWNSDYEARKKAARREKFP